MTTYYKTFNSKIRPISLFRYPHKKWKNFTTEGYTKYQNKTSLVTQTFEINGNTIDFKFYKGDEKQFKNYIDVVLKVFGLDITYDHSLNDYEYYYLHKYFVEHTSNTDHYTVLCNNCELWGNERTKKYVEIFPTKLFKEKRSERIPLYGYFKNGKFTHTFEEDDVHWSGIEEKTKTPSHLLLRNCNLNFMIDKITEKVKELPLEELLYIEKLVHNECKKLVKENIVDNSQSVKVGMEGVLQ